MSSIGVRLREERDRLGMNQSDFASAAGTTRKTQFNYETDQRRPDADYLAALAAIGVDVMYVLTGSRSSHAPAVVLSAEEKLLLQYFREASKDVKRAALGALLGATQATQIGGNHSQHSSGIGAIQIGSIGSAPTTRRRRQ